MLCENGTLVQTLDIAYRKFEDDFGSLLVSFCVPEGWDIRFDGEYFYFDFQDLSPEQVGHFGFPEDVDRVNFGEMFWANRSMFSPVDGANRLGVRHDSRFADAEESYCDEIFETLVPLTFGQIDMSEMELCEVLELENEEVTTRFKVKDIFDDNHENYYSWYRYLVYILGNIYEFGALSVEFNTLDLQRIAGFESEDADYTIFSIVSSVVFEDLG